MVTVSVLNSGSGATEVSPVSPPGTCFWSSEVLATAGTSSFNAGGVVAGRARVSGSEDGGGVITLEDAVEFAVAASVVVGCGFDTLDGGVFEVAGARGVKENVEVCVAWDEAGGGGHIGKVDVAEER